MISNHEECIPVEEGEEGRFLSVEEYIGETEIDEAIEAESRNLWWSAE